MGTPAFVALSDHLLSGAWDPVPAAPGDRVLVVVVRVLVVVVRVLVVVVLETYPGPFQHREYRDPILLEW